MFIKESKVKKKLLTFILKIFNFIENNGNTCFESNGERRFISCLFSAYLKKDVCDLVVFDIGANKGTYSLMFLTKLQSSKIDVKLHLFEPTATCFSILKDRYSNDNRVSINNFGASNVNGYAQIYYDKDTSGIASLYKRNLEEYGMSLDNDETIYLSRMDKYIESNEIKHIHFVKLDVEGHELCSLEGFGSYLNSDFIDFIQFEYGGANLDSHSNLMDFYTLLTNKGFVLAKIMPNGLSLRRGYMAYMDNFNYSNYVAVSERFL